MHKINSKLKNNSYGFTLIELLVVISIIAMLASVMYAFFGTSRARAMDAKKRIEVREVGTALRLYYENNGTMPRNHKGDIVAEEGDTYYEQSMQELLDDKVISAIPKSTDGSHYYYYYSNSKPDGECATFFTYSRLTGEPIFTGCEGVVKKINLDKGCNASQVWNGSACVTENPYTGPVSPPPAPNVIVDDTNNTVQGMVDGMEYSLDGVAYVPYNANTFYTIDFSGDHTLLVRYSSSGNIPASYITTLIFTTNIAPIVTSISPDTAVPGTLLWVYGNNFDTVNQNIIKISKESDSLIYYYYPSSPASPIIKKIPFWLPNYPIGNYHITVNNSQYGNGVVYKTLTVRAPGMESSVGILNPNGGETLTLGNQYTIRWNANNMPPPANNLPNFSIFLLNDATGASLGFIAKDLGAYATSYAWTVGRIYAESDTNSTNPITVSAGKYRIIVKSGIGRNSTSVSYFTIVDALSPPPAPNVTRNDDTNTVSGMTTAMEYNLDGAGYVKYNATTFNSINFSGNHTLLVRYFAFGNTPASYVTTLTFTTNIVNVNAMIRINIDTRLLYFISGSESYSLSNLFSATASGQNIDIGLAYGIIVSSAPFTYTSSFGQLISMNSAATVNTGDLVTINQNNFPGLIFTGWEGPCTGTGSCTFTVTGDVNIIAHYSK